MVTDEKKTVTLQWEPVRNVQQSGAALPHLLRTHVPGGWLVANETMAAIVFVPDERHGWVTEDESKERTRGVWSGGKS